MIGKRESTWIVGMVLLAAPGVILAAIPKTETFDADTAGFVPNTTSSTVVHTGSGGNPGGHILTRKDLAPPVFDIGALTTSADFTGDYAAAGIAKASVDLNFQTDNITGAWIRFRPSIVANGWLFPLTNSFPTNVWNTYSVVFNPAWTDLQAKAAGWVTDQDVNPIADPSPSFASVMSSVYSAEVRLASDGSTIAGIDNFSIAVPEPTSMALLAMGGLAMLRRTRR